VIFFSQCKEVLFDEGKLGFFFDFTDLRRITQMVIGGISNFEFSISNLLISGEELPLREISDFRFRICCIRAKNSLVEKFGFSISNLLVLCEELSRRKPATDLRNQKIIKKIRGQESAVKSVPLGFYLKRDVLEFAGDGNSDR
jgi:hypothetical protein